MGYLDPRGFNAGNKLPEQWEIQAKEDGKESMRLPHVAAKLHMTVTLFVKKQKEKRMGII